MLITGAEIGGAVRDVRIEQGRIEAIGVGLAPYDGERTLTAAGGALLPGLHDHHIHLNAAAAALASVRCGPGDVQTGQALAAALHAAPGQGWLRGVGYHPSVGVALDRAWLDRHGPPRPVRIQHRSGRLWIVNSRAAAELGPGVPDDGCLLDADHWLASRLPRTPPDLQRVGRLLTGYGITGVTEATMRNGPAEYHRLATAGLPQALLIMGGASLYGVPALARARPGPVKLHYHDHDLPALDALAGEVGRAHAARRPVAAHCVTLAELMLTLAAIDMAGAHPGDRIEHGAIVPPEAACWIAALQLTVVSQPHFLDERGDAYRADVPPQDRCWLYRLAGLRAAGIKLAAGSDAPFGGLNPWRAMQAAVQRPPGFGPGEALTPEQALALYTGAAEAPGRRAASCRVRWPIYA
jgi:predicted amidohydrolase YtcJ